MDRVPESAAAAELGEHYAAGRLNDVVLVLQRALSDCEKYLGPDHQMTQTVRENLDAATLA